MKSNRKARVLTVSDQVRESCEVKFQQQYIEDVLGIAHSTLWKKLNRDSFTNEEVKKLQKAGIIA